MSDEIVIYESKNVGSYVIIESGTNDRQIIEMDGKQALDWWKVYKPVLQGIVADMRSNKDADK